MAHQFPVFEALNDEQDRAYNLLGKSHFTILMGRAGTSKTFTAMAFAIDQLLAKRVDRLILTRPAMTSCGEELGFMPGDIREKMAPFLHPLTDKIEEYAPGFKTEIKYDVVPLAYMRGRSFRNSIIIMDEAQNATESQLRMFCTRIGEGSRMIILGDPGQSDLRESPLASVARDLARIKGITSITFPNEMAICRHPILPAVEELFEERRNRERVS